MPAALDARGNLSIHAPLRRGVPYQFTSAQQLLDDFFNEVDSVLKEAKS